MKNLGSVFIAVMIALFIQGCAAKKEVVEPKIVEVVKEDKKVISNTKYYSINTSTTSTIEDTVNEIATQLLATMKIKPNVEAIAVTSFVDLHQLNKTTYFGRVIGESFFNELHSRGLTIADFRGQRNLIVNADGEFFISRDIKKLNTTVTTKYVLIGTYSRVEEGVIINSRIIDNLTGIVVASSRVVHHSLSCEIFENCKKEEPKPVVSKQKLVLKTNKRTIGLSTDGCSTISCPKNCTTLSCYEGVNSSCNTSKKVLMMKKEYKDCNYK
jgi:TolB-like protein